MAGGLSPTGGTTAEHGIFDGAWTLPNLITLVRLALIPIYLWLVLGRHAYVGAGVLLGGLGATDWVDGFLARRWGQVSELGKVLDPVADRVLVVTSVLTVAGVGAVPWWFAILTLVREVLVSAATLSLASLGAARIDVLFVGKAGAMGLMFAYPSFLIGHGHAGWQDFFVIFGWGAGLIGIVCAWVALASYIAPARDALRRGRAARRTNR